MADEEQLAILKQGVETWNEWRRKNQDIGPDLSMADLRGMNLGPDDVCNKKGTRINLRGVDLRGADFGPADPTDPKGTRVNLRWADLRGANLGPADLVNKKGTRANLRWADLRGAYLGPIDVFGQRDEKVNLRWADLRGADLGPADHANPEDTGVTLIRADLKGANLGPADPADEKNTSVNLRWAKLNWADLGPADPDDPEGTGVNLRWADLRSAILEGAILTRATLHHAGLSWADLTDANLLLANYSTRSMRRNVYGVIGVDRIQGNPVFRRNVLDQMYIDHVEQSVENKKFRKRLFRIWGLLDYGRCLSCVAVIGFAVAMIFAGVYAACPGMLDFEGSADTWFTPIYYSVVTFTTLGFGDVTPRTLVGEVLVMIEVILGYLTLGLLLAVLAQRVARRS